MRIGEGVIETSEKNGLVRIEVQQDPLYKASESVDSLANVYVRAKNDLGAQSGDWVRYEMDDSHLGRLALVFFGLPILFMLIFGFIVNLLTTSLAASLIGGVVGLIIGFIIGKAYANRIGQTQDTQARITKILDQEEIQKINNHNYPTYTETNVLTDA